MTKHKTQITLDIEVVYEELEPLSVGSQWLPAMVDIKKVYVFFKHPNGRTHRIRITEALTEEQKLLLEDEILDLQEKYP